MSFPLVITPEEARDPRLVIRVVYSTEGKVHYWIANFGGWTTGVGDARRFDDVASAHASCMALGGNANGIYVWTNLLAIRAADKKREG